MEGVMAVWIWLGIGLLVVLVLLAAWTVDRRGSGHARSVKDISRDLREQDRDNRVVDAQGYVDTGGTWKYRPRRPGDRS
jgi:hypothetical protein